MPCSCTAKQKTVSIRSSFTSRKTREVVVKEIKDEKQENKQSILQIVSNSSSTLAPDSISQQPVNLSSYDFSSNTQPSELCYNCIRKHLGIAYILLEQTTEETLLTALGQILCASVHLTDSNPQLHNVMQNRVLRTIRGNKDHIIYDLLDWIKNIETVDIKEDLIKPSAIQQNIIGLLLAYGLLFIQVSYQQLNKTWATAQLMRGGIKKFSEDHNFQQFQQVRHIWKLIQSMQPYDQTYWDARKLLYTQLQTQWQKYKASLTPAT